MARSLFKHISEFLRADQDELFTPFHSPIPPLGSFFQCSHLLRCGAVFSLSIVGGLDVYLTQGDDVSAANDPNIFAACCCGEPTTEAFLGVRNSKSLHKVFISPIKRLGQTFGVNLAGLARELRRSCA